MVAVSYTSNQQVKCFCSMANIADMFGHSHWVSHMTDTDATYVIDVLYENMVWAICTRALPVISYFLPSVDVFS